MNIASHRLLGFAAAVTAIAFLVALIVRHAKHGVALYLGDVAWFTFLAGVVITAALGLATLVRLGLARRRPATH
jgi:hypothetical protein